MLLRPKRGIITPAQERQGYSGIRETNLLRHSDCKDTSVRRQLGVIPVLGLDRPKVAGSVQDRTMGSTWKAEIRKEKHKDRTKDEFGLFSGSA